jgi:hypothetical protein
MVLGGSDIALTGELLLRATHTAETATLAKGDATGSDAAVGISVGVGIAEDSVSASLKRGVQASAGGVSLLASGVASSRTAAEASATGAAEDDSGSSADDNAVNERTDSEVANANTQSSSRTRSGGSSGETGAEDASTSDGAVSAAAAVAINVARFGVAASIDGGTVQADGAVSVIAEGNMDAEASADGSASKGDPATIGAAVAIDTATGSLRASIANSTITADGVTVAARVLTVQEDREHSFSASATSGASGGDVGVAGAVAINHAGLTTEALLLSGALLTAADGSDAGSDIGDVTVSATARTSTTVTVEAKQEKGDEDGDGTSDSSVGIGASVGVNIGQHATSAEIHNGANVVNAGNLVVLASAEQEQTTSVTGGASGGTAITPVVAIAVAQNDVTAAIEVVFASHLYMLLSHSSDNTRTHMRALAAEA